jgi:methionine-rich copper-binding protein CopC
VIIITDKGFRNKYSAVLNLRLQVVLIAANTVVLLCIATYLQTNSDYAHKHSTRKEPASSSMTAAATAVTAVATVTATDV